MATFKINVSHKGKTVKYESGNEALVGKIINEKISGDEVSQELKGYELEITGTSDKAGFPGMSKLSGAMLKRVLLTYGWGMHKRPKGERKKSDKPSGLRLRKSVRGNEISEDTFQINIKVIKEGDNKFDSLGKKEEPEKEGDKKE